jgi:hypothetical protein
LPAKRLTHDIGTLSDKGVDRSYPERVLFFDSESHVPKPDAPFDGTMIAIPHIPRMISFEAWKMNAAGNDYVAIPYTNEGRWMHLAPMPPGDTAPVTFTAPDGSKADEMCKRFWEAVSEFALGDWGHGVNHGTVYVFGHNVGYDMITTGAYTHLPGHRCNRRDAGDGTCGGWVVETPYSKGPVYIQRAKHGLRTIVILSSTNYFVAKLAAVAKDLGVPDKIEYDKELFAKKDLTDAEWVELQEYCRRDVEIVRRAMIWLVKTLMEPDKNTGKQLAPFRMTISSIAFSAWRYSFMTSNVAVHTNRVATKLERDGFFGGRTETDYVGDVVGEVHCLDVNNLYGYIMAMKRLPRKLVKVLSEDEAPSPEDLRKWIEDPDYPFVLIAQVYVDMKEPAVPVKDPESHKLLFKTGTFETTLCSPELRLVFRYGDVLSVGKVALYEAAPIFKEYVDYMSKKRVEADEAHEPAKRQLYKNLVVNAYGKLGQQSEEWVRVGPPVVGVKPHVEEFIRPDGTRIIRQFTTLGEFESTGVKQESFNSFPAVAAYITSSARCRLWDLMVIARKHGPKHLFYRDTDSLMCDRVGYQDLEKAGELHPTTLGMLKEEWCAPYVKFEGAKFYTFFVQHEQHQPGMSTGKFSCVDGWRIDGDRFVPGVPTTEPHYVRVAKHKGIGADAEMVVTENGPRFIVDQWPGWAGHLRDGDIGHFHNRRMFKKATTKYEKGVVGDDGWVTAFHSSQLPPARCAPVMGV